MHHQSLSATVFVVLAVQMLAQLVYCQSNFIGLHEQKIMINLRNTIWARVLNVVFVLMSAQVIFHWFNISAKKKQKLRKLKRKSVKLKKLKFALKQEKRDYKKKKKPVLRELTKLRKNVVKKRLKLQEKILLQPHLLALKRRKLNLLRKYKQKQMVNQIIANWWRNAEQDDSRNKLSKLLQLIINHPP